MEVNLRDIFDGLAYELDLDPSTVSYCRRRLRNEGVKFFTVTLPMLSKAVLHSIEYGTFERPTNFAWQGRSLRYFRSLLSRIFDRNGKVLPELDALALYEIRTIGEYFYKLALPFDEETLVEQEELFVKEDDSLERDSFDWSFIERLRRDFETNFSFSTGTHFDAYKHRRPYFTNGNFSCDFKLDEYYIHKIHASVLPGEYHGEQGFFKPYPGSPEPIKIGRDTSDFSRVLFVPKDSRGPRTIVKEPLMRLTAQMSFHVWLRDNLNRESHGRVNFVNQQVNRDLARTSSISRQWATLDLRSASDRVAFSVINHITRNCEAFRYFLRRRSTSCILPSGRIHKLKKVAGMGSGLTFPTMSLLIYLASCRMIANQGVTYKDAMKLVYVYGDDIIVPTKYADLVRTGLTRIGLQVNMQKSYQNSFFRESCGGDFYKGQDVGPLRLRLSNCANDVKDNILVVSGSQNILQFERHARECVKHGFTRLADLYYRLIEKTLKCRLPHVSGDSPVLGRYSLIANTNEDSDEYGNVKSGKYWTAEPVKMYVGGAWCPYKYLGQHLAKDLSKNMIEYYEGISAGSTYEEIAIPRCVKYRRTRKSNLVLHV